MANKYSGTIALVGKPNAGKSTLLNKLLDYKLSIVTHKAQTTRHNLLGVRTEGSHQLLFIDTPGMHSKQKRDLNRWMNRAASDAIKNADLIIFLVTIGDWSQDDQWVLDVIKKSDAPVLLCINKLDILGGQDKLNTGIEKLMLKHDFSNVTSISAKKSIGLETLVNWCKSNLPLSEHMEFEADEISDRPQEFFIAEAIREQILLRFHEELPYASHVEVELLEEKNSMLHVHATIFVETEGQKKIIIGKGGLAIKEIGKRARIRLEKKIDQKIFLKLWVHVKEKWTDSVPGNISQDLF